MTEDVLARVEESREDLAELALRLGNTYSPWGSERILAEEVVAWYREQDMAADLVPITATRANAVARLRGSGGGRTIVFNAHLDTEASGDEYDRLMAVPDPNRVGGRREGDRLFGHTVLNDRGPMSLFMIAGRALRDAGVELRGDVVLTSVAGETGAAPVDEYTGVAYEGKGFGSDYLVRHGVRGDCALVAETTDFGLCWFNCGAAYYKITLSGRNMYTPRLRRPGSLADHPNAIVKAAAVVEAVEAWAIAMEERRSRETACGPVRPKAQVGAIRGGLPWRPNRSSPYCALYVDVRTLPGEDVDEVTASLRAAVDATGTGADVSLIMAKPGFEAGDEVQPLADAVRAAHRAVRGAEPPPQVETAVVSMWRDTNVFNGHGIPSLTFGPSRGRADVQGEGFFALDDLVDAAKMYALVALEVAA
ncbi:MAG TPA: M20/M25/M40 family metallo-hydrolase [Solirubrobacter sp.]|nr:M20/M25/M40 family metallo-hydrolase [Solirubrobacter sp.]